MTLQVGPKRSVRQGSISKEIVAGGALKKASIPHFLSKASASSRVGIRKTLNPKPLNKNSRPGNASSSGVLARIRLGVWDSDHNTASSMLRGVNSLNPKP